MAHSGGQTLEGESLAKKHVRERSGGCAQEIPTDPIKRVGIRTLSNQSKPLTCLLFIIKRFGLVDSVQMEKQKALVQTDLKRGAAPDWSSYNYNPLFVRTF